MNSFLLFKGIILIFQNIPHMVGANLSHSKHIKIDGDYTDSIYAQIVENMKFIYKENMNVHIREHFTLYIMLSDLGHVFMVANNIFAIVNHFIIADYENFIHSKRVC